MKKVIICAEASAVHLKNAIVDFLEKEGYEYTDATERDDFSYIEAGSIIGESISKGRYAFGIVMCGSGMGVNLVANRYPGVYCGLCESLHTAKMARSITNCNVLALGGNIVAYDLACRMVKAFLDTQFGEGFSEGDAEGLRKMFSDMNDVDVKTHA
ncbi:MAG: RpiB/LacA/LacB family sugar-phosphate isomerase [Lachnospiraceae bacterium]|nr:RpiB/LacA/LacB family sugar-phosphate isomerase [Lachnospiraceae bacterium]